MVDYTVSHRFINDIALIKVTGGCDDRCTKEMETLLNRLIATGYKRYILDVTDLSFAESSAFRLLIRKVEDIQDSGGNLIVTGLSGRVERAFNLLKLGSLVPIAKNVSAAIAGLNDAQYQKLGTGMYGQMG